jgi:hypothetical protein
MKHMFPVASVLVICALGMLGTATLGRIQWGSTASDMGHRYTEATVAQCRDDTAQLQTPGANQNRLALLEQQSKLVSDPSPAYCFAVCTYRGGSGRSWVGESASGDCNDACSMAYHNCADAKDTPCTYIRCTRTNCN